MAKQKPKAEDKKSDAKGKKVPKKSKPASQPEEQPKKTKVSAKVEPEAPIEEESEEALDEEFELDEELEDEIEEIEDDIEEPTPTSTEVEYVEERQYVVPFRKLVYVTRNKRAAKAIRMLREFATKHMKSEIVIIDQKVNEQIWARGIKHPPRKISVRMAKDRDGFVYVLPVTF
jgi:large subunit ribosomal protein L31e